MFSVIAKEIWDLFGAKEQLTYVYKNIKKINKKRVRVPTVIAAKRNSIFQMFKKKREW